jgi:hypothetical protein
MPLFAAIIAVGSPMYPNPIKQAFIPKFYKSLAKRNLSARIAMQN